MLSREASMTEVKWAVDQQQSGGYFPMQGFIATLDQAIPKDRLTFPVTGALRARKKPSR